MARTQSPQYNSPLKQEADARSNRLVEARNASRQQQLAANVLKGAKAAETTPGYTADPMTGLLVSDRTIAEMSGKVEQPERSERSISELLGFDVESARKLYEEVVGEDKVPTLEQITERLSPEGLKTLQTAREAMKTAGQNPETVLVPTGLSLEEWKKIDPRIGKYGHGTASVYEEGNDTDGRVTWSLAVLPTNPKVIQRKTAPADPMDISMLTDGGVDRERIARPRTEDVLALVVAAGQTDKPWPFGERYVFVDTEKSKTSSLASYVNVRPAYGDVVVRARCVSNRHDVGGAFPAVRVKLGSL